ncbi:MAG: baseplate J/gp47 family protein [Gammaproteobacteria bacterium]|nr:baseplate J/gp47 family protein [Gammaproteobacteria bacterium]
MRITDPERRKIRARNLADAELNGLELLFVELLPAVAPIQAELCVQFYNEQALTQMVDRIGDDPNAISELFTLSGGTRILAGSGEDRLHISALVYDAAEPRILRLTTSGIGDYSTYTLSVAFRDTDGIDGKVRDRIDPLFNGLPFKFRPGCFNLNCFSKAETETPPETPPAIDYLARDFDSIKHVLITAMRDRVPGWEPTSEASLDMVILDLLAADADQLCDFQDRILQEAYFGLARKRLSLTRHARLMDYHVHQGNQAGTWLVVEVAAGVGATTLPVQTTVWTGDHWDKPDAVIYLTGQAQPCWEALNHLQLYTWGGVVSALEAGACEAELAIPQSLMDGSSAHPAEDLRDILQACGLLVIEEKLNPQTGTHHGRDLTKRQLLHLLSDQAAEVAVDPFSGEAFVRVRWDAADRLTQRYCFITQCDDELPVAGVSAFHGNLVYATQGRLYEVIFRPPGSELGEADDTQPLHHAEACWEANPWGALATLPSGPLAYLETPPGGEIAPRSSLVVTVDGSTWEERIDLIESEDNDAHFLVETDERGMSRLRFGNGSNGQRLDAAAVVNCRFQVGGGISGNLGADSLSGFDSLAGDPLASLRNPFDVHNGRDPEPREEIIRRAPEAYRQRQLRAVTLADYVERAEALPEVAHAYARFAWTGSWRTVQVSVDPRAGTSLDAVTLEHIATHLDAVRLIGDDLEVRPARYVALDITLTLCAKPEYWPEHLEAELQSAFSNTYTPEGQPGFFHPDAWTFGQSLHASQIIGRALQVPGIERVTSLSMRRWNAGSGSSTRIVEIQAADLPQALVDRIDVQPFEIIQVANDPDHLELGRILFELRGGPQ